MNQKTLNIHCPITGIESFQPCEPAELDPLIAHLESSTPTSSAITFTRGTLLPDGRLDLCKQKLGPQGCQKISTTLQSNKFVKSLLLGTDGIGDEGASSIAKLVEHNESLETLYLGCNNITGDGAETIAQALRSNQTIQGLWLKRNPIGDRGAFAIAELLESGSPLKVLDLVNTGIGRTGLNRLLPAIASSQVQSVYLGGNQLDAEDARSISSLLVGTNIDSLLLNVNHVGDAGAKEIAKAIRKHAPLKNLGLASNGIGIEGATEIFEALADHHSMQYLDLGWAPSTKVLGASPNHLGRRGTQIVAKFLEANPKLYKLNLRNTGFDISEPALARAMEQNQSLTSMVLEQKLPESIENKLQSNQENRPHESGLNLVAMIRSVYR